MPGVGGGLLVEGGTRGSPPGRERAAVSGPPDPEAGRAIFAARHAAPGPVPRGEPGAGPALEQLRRPQGEMQLAGRLWNHVPTMFATLDQKGLEWPRITGAEM